MLVFTQLSWVHPVTAASMVLSSKQPGFNPLPCANFLFRGCNGIHVMKTDIHPKYYPQAKISCACGNTFTVGSAKERLEVEICSKCHPFYTGGSKIVDTAGRVEKFRQRLAKKRT